MNSDLDNSALDSSNNGNFQSKNTGSKLLFSNRFRKLFIFTYFLTLDQNDTLHAFLRWVECINENLWESKSDLDSSDLWMTENTETLDDQETIEGAINHCLKIISYECLEFIIDKLELLKVQPIVNILSVSEIIK